MANRSRVLVTGGAGFIGRRVVRALLAEGHEVTVADLRTFPDTAVRSVIGDLCDPEVPARAVRPGTDVIIHLAAVTSVLCFGAGPGQHPPAQRGRHRPAARTGPRERGGDLPARVDERGRRRRQRRGRGHHRADRAPPAHPVRRDQGGGRDAARQLRQLLRHHRRGAAVLQRLRPGDGREGQLHPPADARRPRRRGRPGPRRRQHAPRRGPRGRHRPGHPGGLAGPAQRPADPRRRPSRSRSATWWRRPAGSPARPSRPSTCRSATARCRPSCSTSRRRRRSATGPRTTSRPAWPRSGRNFDPEGSSSHDLRQSARIRRWTTPPSRRSPTPTASAPPAFPRSRS